MMYFTETEALRELEILMQMIPGFQPKGYGLSLIHICIVWATPIADVCAMIVAIIVLVPFWKMLSSQEKKDPAGT